MMIFISQDILIRLRRIVSRGLLVPAILRSGMEEYVDLERRALEGHVNDVRTRAELIRDCDNWLDMLSLQWDLLTESRVRLERDQHARLRWRDKALRRFRKLVFGRSA